MDKKQEQPFERFMQCGAQALTNAELLALIPKAPSMLGVKFDQLTIPEEGHYGGMPVMNGNGGFAPDLDYHARLLEEFLYGNDD